MTLFYSVRADGILRRIGELAERCPSLARALSARAKDNPGMLAALAIYAPGCIGKSNDVGSSERLKSEAIESRKRDSAMVRTTETTR